MHEAFPEIHSSRDFSPESSTRAKSLLHTLGEFELIIALCVTRHLMTHFKNVTIALHRVDVDIVMGYKMIQTVKNTLQVVSFHRT